MVAFKASVLSISLFVSLIHGTVAQAPTPSQGGAQPKDRPPRPTAPSAVYELTYKAYVT
jgi:hypothetical protein